MIVGNSKENRKTNNALTWSSQILWPLADLNVQTKCVYDSNEKLPKKILL